MLLFARCCRGWLRRRNACKEDPDTPTVAVFHVHCGPASSDLYRIGILPRQCEAERTERISRICGLDLLYLQNWRGVIRRSAIKRDLVILLDLATTANYLAVCRHEYSVFDKQRGNRVRVMLIIGSRKISRDLLDVCLRTFLRSRWSY